jgi:hypothetical protein
MRQITGNASVLHESSDVNPHLAAWNRRLMVTAAVFIMGSATMLALQVAGPEARALIASEGMVVTSQ